MKRTLCLLISVLMCAMLFTGCGKFDMENADISKYVTLGDISEIPYENLVKAYENYREYLSEDMASCALSTGDTIDFFVKAELLDEEGNVLQTIEKWTHETESDMVKGYDVYRNPSLFDDALMYTVTEAGAQNTVGRTVEIGKEFFFTMKIAEDYEDEALAGETVKFTLNVQKVLPAVYPDSYIAERLNEFFKAAKFSKETVENGDTPCVRYGEIYSKYNQAFYECETRTNLSLNTTPKYFSYGDILFTCTGELVEEIGKSVVYLGQDECLAGGDIIVMKHSQNPVFLNYALNSQCAQAQKSCDKTKLKVVHISASDIGNILLALPPIAEQEEIADYLDKKCSEIDTLIEKKTALLEEMETYKKSVIYEYVTGKKEVL